MKAILNIFMLFVLVFNQAGQSPLSRLANQAETPAATLTPTSESTATETPWPDTATPANTATETPVIETPTSTETPIPNTATPTGTPELPPTETNTPENTASPTATQPGTATPSSEYISVSLNSLPGFITRNGTVVLRWTIIGDRSPYAGLRLQIQLPKPFSIQGKHHGAFDSNTGILEFPVSDGEGQIVLRAESPDIASLITASLFDGKQLLATDEYLLPTHEQFLMNKKGGQISALGGKLKVTFPQDTLSENASINIGIPTKDEAPTSSPSGRPFEIRASSLQGDTRITQFPKSITFELQIDPEEIYGDPLFLHFVWYDPSIQAWVAIPSSFDAETYTLTATTDHFSAYDIDASDWNAARTPTIDAFQVSSYTGAATYSMPIEVPAGPGGLQPNLALSYNSQVVDQANIKTQASWVGMGWSLDAQYIERNTHGTASYGNDDTWSLVLNGVSTMIVQSGGVYRTSDEQYWRIEFDETANYGQGAWTVWDKVGNKYEFTKTAGMAYPLIDYPDVCEYGTLTYRWSLTKVTNIFGQELTYSYYNQKTLMVFNYENETKCASEKRDKYEVEIDSAVYLDKITYPNDRYRVRFVRENRTDYPLEWDRTGEYHTFEKYRLGSVVVEQDSDDNGSFETSIRTYQFTYAPDTTTGNRVLPGKMWSAGGRALTLRSVTVLGKNETASLPPTTFSYEDLLHLTKATNGYGGSVEYFYSFDETGTWDQDGVWYETNGTTDANTMTHTFGKSGMPCDELGYSTWAWKPFDETSHVQCDTNYSLGSPLFIIHTARYTYTPEYMIRPGAYYKVYAKFGTASFTSNVKVGIRDNKNRNSYTEPVSLSPDVQKTVIGYFRLEPDSNNISAMLYSSNANNFAALSTVSFQLMPTFYRVTQKTVNDGNGNSFDYTYSYNGAAMNNADNSDVCQTNPPGAGPTPIPTPTATGEHCLSYTEPYSEFRGHNYVTEIGPDGKKITTYFYQGIRNKDPDPNNFNVEDHDAFKGRPYLQVIKNANNKVLAETITRYASTDLPFVKPRSSLDGAYNKGIYHRWIRTASEESRIYDNNDNYTATRSVYAYESQYGNLTSITRQRWTGSQWKNFTKEEYEYFFQNTTTKYLVGFQAAKKIYSCVTDWTCPTLLAATYSLYDGNTEAYNTPPTVGKLTRTRTWVSDYLEPADLINDPYADIGYTYDTWGNQASIFVYPAYASFDASPASGRRITTTEYDPDYHTYPIKQTDPLGYATKWEYDFALGLPLREISPNTSIDDASTDGKYTPNDNGEDTEAQYDAFGRMTKLIRPGDLSYRPTIKITYNDGDPFSTEISQRIYGNTYFTIQRHYDGIGRQDFVVTGTGSTIDGNFSMYNQVDYDYAYTGTASTPSTTSQSMPYDPDTEVPVYTVTTNDVLGRPKKIAAPDGTQTTYAYDGLLTTITDANDHATTTETDVWGRTVEVTPPAGPAISYTYDPLGRLTKATRAGNETSLAYNSIGQKLSMDDPDMGTWTYTYNALGVLKTQKDARNCTLTMYYDQLNRLTRKLSVGSGCGQQVDSNYYYDGVNPGSTTSGQIGYRTAMTDISGGSSEWVYDTRGRMSQETKTITGQAFTTRWGYNSADLPTWMKYPDNETVDFDYNEQMMLETLKGNDDYITATTYDIAGRVKTRTLGDNVLTQQYDYYEWDETALVGTATVGQGGRLQNLSVGTLQNLSYLYDAVGNVREINDSIKGDDQSFEYDSLNRLTSASASGIEVGVVTVGNYADDYSYNPTTGNLEAKAGMTPLYGDADHKHAVSSTDNGTPGQASDDSYYTYDDNGNMIKRVVDGQTVALEYDAENRLVKVCEDLSNNASCDANEIEIATFIYDGNGSRVISNNNGETILFAGAHYELNTTDSEVIKYYFAGATRVAMRKYVVPESDELTYLLGDHLGSTSLATDETGALLVETRYKAWGEVRYTTADSTLPTRYTFTGQYSYVSDEATDLGSAGFGLMYYNARWYDPYLNHFTQPDSIVPDPYNSQSYDRYSYANNNPVRYIDPSGHDVQCTDEGCYETSDAGCNTNIPGAAACATSIVIIICGIGGSDPGVCNNGDAFKDYIAKLRAEGKRVEVYDVDNYSGNKKDNASNDILSFMEGVLRKIPRAKFTIAGHSAGADAAILSGYKAVKAGIGNSISGIGLLDPTLTAGPDNPNNGDMMDEMKDILDAGIRVFVGDGIGGGSDEDEGVITQEYLSANMLKDYGNQYSYIPYIGMYHGDITKGAPIDAMDSFLFP